MSVDARRSLFDDLAEASDPADVALSGADWRRLRLACRPWPKRRCAAGGDGRLVLQHKVTKGIRSAPTSCGTWGCPACGDYKGKGVLDRLVVHLGPDDDVHWAYGTGATEHDRLRKQRQRSKTAGYVWIRRRDTYHLFSDGGPGRACSMAEALLVARFVLRPGVVRVWGPWVGRDLDPIYRRIDYAPAEAVRRARERAEEVLLKNHGVAYSFEEGDPPSDLADVVAGEFMAALAVIRGRRS